MPNSNSIQYRSCEFLFCPILIREIDLFSLPFSLKSSHSEKVSFRFCFDLHNDSENPRHNFLDHMPGTMH
ncbi:hypothetical protein LEP1GSC121_0615 [Leptospira borgpetersenii serovar Castellonis str. 200801910]|nr:hypothetical protein LEP1GSC121_0615 [Leptospira borgpetersenii serovar Castellonis str. 200801910]